MSITRRRLLAAVPAGGVAAAGLAGCTGTSSSSSERLLTVLGSSQFTRNFNPFSSTPLEGTWGIIYEPLYFFNQAKADDQQPLLATGYEFNSDGTALRFTLRSGVTWSDGNPFSADDVVFTFNLIKNDPKLNTDGLPITGVTAADTTHVTLRFSEPVYTRLWNIAGQTWIIPEHIWRRIKDPSTTTNETPVGTGPFTYGTFSAQSYTLIKNKTYWDTGKPKIPGLRFVTNKSNDSATAMLATDQVDWAGAFITNIQKQYVDKDPAHHKYLNESQLLFTNLVPNLDRPPFNEVAVRKAISAALDRDRLIKLAFSGYGKYPSPAEIMRPLFDKYLKPAYKDAKLLHDPARSRRLLEGAGYTEGSDGFYAKDGSRISIACKVVTGYSDYISALQIIKQELKDVGIDFDSQQVSFSEFASDQQTGNFQMLITNGYGGPAPYYMYNNLLSSTMTAPIGQKASQNFSRFRNATVDRALRTIERTNPDDIDTLREQYYKIQDVVVDQMPYIPIQQSSALAEYSTEHFTGWPTADDHYALALTFDHPDNAIVAKNLVPVD